MGSFVLLHPPLLGPAVWGPCAAVLAAGGDRVAVPDLRAAMDPPERWWERATDLAAGSPGAIGATGLRDTWAAEAGASGAAGSRAAEAGAAGSAGGGAAEAGAGGTIGVGGGAGPVVVAHSGAGVLLPLVATRLAAAAAVFVDAVLPPAGTATPSEDLREFLAGLPVVDGRLPPWSTWWGPDVMARLVPDPGLRHAIEADQRPLPVAFYDHSVPVPADWTPPRAGYLRLSPAYAEDAAEAAARGWPVRVLDGQHLDLATRPAEVAAGILALSGV